MDSTRPAGPDAMTRRSFRIASRCVRAALGTALPLLMLLVAGAPTGSAQAGPYERTYRQSKSAVERALKELQPSTGGRLPALEGFALPGDHPLNRYQRAYYQSAVQVTSTASGGSVVRVTTKVTAWYGDSVPSRSGYQLLTSNGRLETDLLDQLTDLLATSPSGTSSSQSFPVVATPSLNGKTLFLESAHDEFEMLDFNADWVHVRISGLSRGWIWRTSLEMPEGISDIPQAGASAVLVAADLFQVTREETAPFPGDWEPLRGKSVKIISVQKIQENEKSGGARAKLEFAKSLLDKNYAELAAKASELAGVVLIFDSVDGGMIAATLPTVQQWKAGTLSDAALWHQCYFDPPETFNVTGPAGGQ